MKTESSLGLRSKQHRASGRRVRQVLGLGTLSLLLNGSVFGAAPTNFFRINLWPPTNGCYTSPQAWWAYYANGVIISNTAWRVFSQGILPPIPGAPQTHNFNATFEMEISMDTGLTWQSVVVTNVGNTVQVGWNSTVGNEWIYTNNMRAFSASGSGLPAGVKIRQSTMSPSLGQTRIYPTPGGYWISSFFDVYTELSLDNGLTWAPASSPAHVELRPDPALITPAAAPRPVLPMPNGQYMAPLANYTGPAYGNGIMIRNMRHDLFTGWADPPAPKGTGQSQTFGLQSDFELSTDGGLSYTAARAPTTMTLCITNTRGFSGWPGSLPGRTTYQTEVTQLDISGGDLPAGVRIRESPTKQSKGGISSLAGDGGGGAGGGAAISSFFDIFTEISTDGGLTWAAATNGPVHEELRRVAPVYTFTNSLIPPATGEYVSVQQPWASYADGIVITNLVLGRFSASTLPPLPGLTTSHTFDAQAEFDISYFGGPLYIHASAPVTVTVQITTRPGGDGTTDYYDTELTQFSLSGGTLVAGVRIRESPLRASLGRTTSSAVLGGAGGYQIDSFFDLHTEVTTDNGVTWWPSLAGPVTMTLQPRTEVTPVTLTIQRWGTNVALTWPVGTLESAGQVTGNYTNVTGAVSPYTNGTERPQQFYRVKVQ